MVECDQIISCAQCIRHDTLQRDGRLFEKGIYPSFADSQHGCILPCCEQLGKTAKDDLWTRRSRTIENLAELGYHLLQQERLAHAGWPMHKRRPPTC